MTQQKKKLLNENTVKRFMQIAKLGNYSNKFLRENFLSEEDPLNEVGEDEMGSDVSNTDMAPPPETEMPEEEMPPESEGNETMVQQLVSAIADAITAQTGINVEVENEGVGAEETETEEPEMTTEPTDSETPESVETMDSEEELTEEKSPLDHAAKGNSPPVPIKKTMPNTPGETKDPEKNSSRVEGAEKPEKIAGKDHKMSDLSERLFKKVMARLLAEVKKQNPKKSK